MLVPKSKERCISVVAADVISSRNKKNGKSTTSARSHLGDDDHLFDKDLRKRACVEICDAQERACQMCLFQVGNMEGKMGRAVWSCEQVGIF